MVTWNAFLKVLKMIFLNMMYFLYLNSSFAISVLIIDKCKYGSCLVKDIYILYIFIYHFIYL